MKKTLCACLVLLLVVMGMPHSFAAIAISDETIISHANSLVGTTYTRGYCLEWVATKFWQALGAPYSSACCAYAHGNSHIVSSSRKNIPIGANVYFGGGTTRDQYNHVCGHIGVHIGNEKIINLIHYKNDPENLSVVRINTISEILSWSTGYTYRGWGYPDGVTLDSTATYSNLEFRDVAYPKTFHINTSAGWDLTTGSIVSDVDLKSIQSILSKNDGSWSQDTGEIAISGKYYALSNINTRVKFSQITPAMEGDFTWTLIAKDKNRTLRMVMPFKAEKNGSTSVTTESRSYPNSDPDPFNPFIPVSEIVFTKKSDLENDDHIGASAIYGVQVLPTNATNKELTFSIDDETAISLSDITPVSDPASAGCDYFITLHNMGIGPAALTAASTDGSNVNAKLDFNVVSNITGVDVKLQRYIDGELEDIGSFAVEHNREFFVKATWYWTFAPDSYNWMFRLDENNGLLFAQDDAGKMNNSGCLAAEETGTYNVYIDFYENGQLVPDGCRTIQVEVVPWLISWINIKQDEVSLPIGTSIALETSMSPTVPTNPNINWASSDSGVATVDAAGVVAAIAPGTATITATAADGGGADDYCTVTVFCLHENSEWKETKAATCTEAGEKKLICGDCGETLDTQEIPPLGHDWDEWKETKAPTCTEKGEEIRVCRLNSEHKETRELPIDPEAHDWGEWVTSSTEKTRVCKNNASHKETIPIDDPAPGPTAQLKASATTMQKDGMFTVTLSLANNPGIGFMVIQSNASGQGITLEKAEAIGAAAGASVTYGTNATLSSTASITGENGILLLTFISEAKEDATIQFSCGQCFTVDEDIVSVTGTSVKVQVVKRIPGDATDDGVVDGRDVLRLMKYFAGQSVTFNASNADVTGDGTVDGRDVLRLMKYFAGQNVSLQ